MFSYQRFKNVFHRSFGVQLLSLLVPKHNPPLLIEVVGQLFGVTIKFAINLKATLTI